MLWGTKWTNTYKSGKLGSTVHVSVVIMALIQPSFSQQVAEHRDDQVLPLGWTGNLQISKAVIGEIPGRVNRRLWWRKAKGHFGGGPRLHCNGQWRWKLTSLSSSTTIETKFRCWHWFWIFPSAKQLRFWPLLSLSHHVSFLLLVPGSHFSLRLQLPWS